MQLLPYFNSDISSRSRSKCRKKLEEVHAKQTWIQGDWATKPMPPAIALAERMTCPDTIRSSPSSACSSADLPEPTEPVTPIKSPGPSCRLMSRSAMAPPLSSGHDLARKCQGSHGDQLIVSVSLTVDKCCNAQTGITPRKRRVHGPNNKAFVSNGVRLDDFRNRKKLFGTAE